MRYAEESKLQFIFIMCIPIVIYLLTYNFLIMKVKS